MLCKEFFVTGSCVVHLTHSVPMFRVNDSRELTIPQPGIWTTQQEGSNPADIHSCNETCFIASRDPYYGVHITTVWFHFVLICSSASGLTWSLLRSENDGFHLWGIFRERVKPQDWDSRRFAIGSVSNCFSLMIWSIDRMEWTRLLELLGTKSTVRPVDFAAYHLNIACFSIWDRCTSSFQYVLASGLSLISVILHLDISACFQPRGMENVSSDKASSSSSIEQDYSGV